MKTLGCSLTNLDWLDVKESERYTESERDVQSEAYERGNKMLVEVLSLFPDLSLIDKTPLMKVEDERNGAFLQRVSFEVYQSEDGQVSVVKNNSIYNPNLSHVLTGFDLVATCQSKERCEDYKSKIRKISKSYEIKDTINEIHGLKLKIE